jgi:superfamily II DNA or RNA helicase
MIDFTPQTPDAAAWQTLETLIAPGGRARLSPFAEAAQFSVLFGRTPDEKSRYDSSQAIIDSHGAEITRVAKSYLQFSQDGRPFRPEVYTADFLKTYLAYYFTANVPKVQLVLLELIRRGLLPDEIRLLDLGVGTGTTAVACLDLMIAWQQIRALYTPDERIPSLQMLGVDSNPTCLEFAARTFSAYGEAIKPLLGGETALQERLAGLAASVESARWEQHDLNGAISPSVYEFAPNLIVISNVFNELDKGKRHLEDLLKSAPSGACIVLLEPGDMANAKSLMCWRREFLAKNTQFRSEGPCGQEFGSDLPDQCTTCWNLRRVSFHQTPLYRAFRDSACDKRTRDEFENNLLSWSYTLLSKNTQKNVDLVAPDPPGSETRTERSPGSTDLNVRYMGSYRSKETHPVPISLSPDQRDTLEWQEYHKFCPATVSGRANRVLLSRRPGQDLPPWRFGQSAKMQNVGVRERDDTFYLEPKPGEETIYETFAESKDFLPSDNEQTRAAIDGLATRLFGFPGMHGFQHQILGRILRGKSTLGIAATGGGKSECFILPALLLPGVTVVVSPLKALMTDQFEQRIKARYGLEHLVTYLNGDVPLRERQTRLRRLEMGYYKMIYLTPEQMERDWVLDTLRRTDEAVGIRYLAMDEAHCISQWGHDFRPAYLNLHRRLEERNINPVRIALTATASPAVRQDICDELGLDPRPVSDGGDIYIDSSNRPELNLVVRRAGTMNKKTDAIVEELRSLLTINHNNVDPGAAIVFLPWTGEEPNSVDYSDDSEDSRRGGRSYRVTHFAAYLERQLQTKVAIYHGKMDISDESSAAGQAEDADADGTSEAWTTTKLGQMFGRTRSNQQVAFIQQRNVLPDHSNIDIMVATKGFGMGIDKPNIRLVVHQCLPTNLEAYAQEAGRAGRDRELATAILFFSPEKSKENENSPREQSDQDVASFFLNERYIREVDVRATRDFLKTVKRGVGGRLYFTNDEFLGYLDSISFGFPKFEERPFRHKFEAYNPEVAEVLDLGWRYQKETEYLGRILSVLVRNRPNTPKGKRLAVLNRSQETGSEIRSPQVHKGHSVIASNTYFGRLLREQGVSDADFQSLIARGDALKIAERLKLPLSETVSVLNDIKSFEKRPGDRLIDFERIVAPAFGPAAERQEWADWLRWAGACDCTRFPEAQERAKRARRPIKSYNKAGQPIFEKSLEDWFGSTKAEKRPNRLYSKGWEVEPGPAFYDDEGFEVYLQHFMDLYKRRESNDRAAYNRLLTDYIGFGREARRQCLRGVMLGYLKSHEAVVGRSCLSCSNCVPGENFETDKKKRAEVVQPLGPGLDRLLDAAETEGDGMPDLRAVEAVLQVLQEQISLGFKLSEYFVGWTGRLIQDAPGHSMATWLRLAAMAKGILDSDTSECDRLIEGLKSFNVSDVGNAYDLSGMLIDHFSESIPLFELRAHACDLLDQYEEAEVAWTKVTKAPNMELARMAWTKLRSLHGPNGACESPELWRRDTHKLAVLSKSSEQACEYCKSLIVGLQPREVLIEASNLSKESPLAQIGLLMALNRMGAKSVLPTMLDRRRMFRLYCEQGTPQDAGEAEVWFDVFGESIIKLAPPEFFLPILEKGVDPAGIPKPMVQKLSPYIQMHEDNQPLQEAWRVQLSKHPEMLIQQAVTDIFQNNLASADSAYKSICESGNVESIQKLFGEIEKLNLASLPMNIKQGVTLYCGLRRLKDEIKATLFSSGSDHRDYQLLFDVFTPRNSVSGADLVVATIRELRERGLFSPNYLTPTAREAEALFYGGRYEECQEMVRKFPGLQVGREKTLLSHWLLGEKGPGRPGPDEERLLRRVVACFVPPRTGPVYKTYR